MFHLFHVPFASGTTLTANSEQVETVPRCCSHLIYVPGKFLAFEKRVLCLLSRIYEAKTPRNIFRRDEQVN